MELSLDSAIALLGICQMNPKTPVQRIYTPKNLYMFIAVLFTVAKIWKQPKCPSVDEWIKKLVHLHNGILLSRKKGIPTFCNSMDGTGDYYAK